MIQKDAKIYVAGHRGLVGSAILSNLRRKGYTRLVCRNHDELDLTDQQEVARFFVAEKPEYVFLAAAKVGGIGANSTYRGQFIYENLMIQNNVIHQAYLNGVKKLLFLGSTCIYPRDAAQPIKEEALLTGPLEYTNEPYALAKIAGIKMCESYNLQYGTDFIAVMPTNLYGPNDNFDLQRSHVLPAMMRKMILANYLAEKDWTALRADLDRLPVDGIPSDASDRQIRTALADYGITAETLTLWGTGSPLREFLWSEEMADACVYLMEEVSFKDLMAGMPSGEIRNTHVNIGTGKELTIRRLAELVRQVVGYSGELAFDASKPDGTPRKLTDVSRLHALGWHHRIEIEEGVEKLYRWYADQFQSKT